MKKSALYFMIMMLSLNMFSTSAFGAEKEPISAGNSPKEIPAEVKIMLNRLEEIKAMDRSEMNATDRKALRKEVRTIKSTLRTSHNGIYISAGAIIIVLLLIIIF